MDMNGSQRIPAPLHRVWAALNDPESLRLSIPGCETVEKLSDTFYTATVTAKIGPVKARFSGKVTVSHVNAPHGYTLNGEGIGGVAGLVRGSADVRLTPHGDETVLGYRVKALVGGKLAQMGSCLIDATARAIAEEFFSRLATEVTRQERAPPLDGAEAAPSPCPEPIPCLVSLVGAVGDAVYHLFRR